MNRPVQPSAPAPDNYVAKNFFTYNVGLAAALAAGGSTTASFNVDGDSDFFWTKLAAFALVADDATTVSAEQLPAISIIITNETTGRRYMNEAIPLPNIAGSSRLPFILPMVTYWAAKTTISVEFFNISDNTAYSDLELSFLGIKAFTK